MKQAGHERRTEPRLELLEYAIVTPIGKDEAFRSIISDVSLGGLQVRSKCQLEEGIECTLQIGRLAEQPLEVKATLVYSRPIADSDLFASGFRINPANNEEKRAWGDFVHQSFEKMKDHIAS